MSDPAAARRAATDAAREFVRVMYGATVRHEDDQGHEAADALPPAAVGVVVRHVVGELAFPRGDVAIAPVRVTEVGTPRRGVEFRLILERRRDCWAVRDVEVA